MSKSVIIIGGGLGGLFTGAILSKEGFRVTVLEKNSTIGGGLQTFHRFGESFDTGMHIIGGMQEGGNIRRLCEWLGIADKIRIKDVDSFCTDRLYFAEDRQFYTMAQGREGFVECLANQFPQQKTNLSAYVDAIYRLVDEIDIFNLRVSDNFFPTHTDEFFMAADQFIAKYISDRRLRSIIAYMNPFYGGRKDQTPAYIHSLISVLYINGTSRFVGGSSHFADLLAEVITDGGGDVLVNAPVTHIDVENRHVKAVMSNVKGPRSNDSDEQTFTADYYISDIHPCSLLNLMDQDVFPKAYRNRLNSIPNSYSAFLLYLKMKKDSFPYINHSEYYMTQYDRVWDFGNADAPWPMGFLMMTPPEENQGQYSEKVLVTAPMLFDCVRKWENTTVGHRGEDYLLWKQQCTEKLLAMVEDIHPGFRDKVEAVNSSSPLTIRDFMGVKEGSMFGYSKDYKNIIYSQIPIITKVDNLLLTGQNNNLHGFCGVPLTAIQTSEAILGRNYIVNKLNNI